MKNSKGKLPEKSLTEKGLRKILDGVGHINARWKRNGAVKKTLMIIMKATKLGLNC